MIWSPCRTCPCEITFSNVTFQSTYLRWHFATRTTISTRHSQDHSGKLVNSSWNWPGSFQLRSASTSQHIKGTSSNMDKLSIDSHYLRPALTAVSNSKRSQTKQRATSNWWNLLNISSLVSDPFSILNLTYLISDFSDYNEGKPKIEAMYELMDIVDPKGDKHIFKMNTTTTAYSSKFAPGREMFQTVLHVASIELTASSTDKILSKNRALEMLYDRIFRLAFFCVKLEKGNWFELSQFWSIFNLLPFRLQSFIYSRRMTSFGISSNLISQWCSVQSRTIP